ncbi:hypothetical protein CPB84DRAFT_1775955, partial [Gymnopilus junonius]
MNVVDTTEEMDFLGGTQAALRGKAEEDADKDPITRALEASLHPAPKDSVGAKILKKMGWRLGQGIGPRVSLKKRKQQDTLAYDPATGARYQEGSLDIHEDDEEANKHTYAPRDTPVLVVKRKDNSHGLGYVPGISLQESLGNNAAGSSKDPRLAGGFGLGALNDADEDDLDVYDVHHQGSRHRVAYDHIGGEGDETVQIGGRTSQQSKPMGSSLTSKQYFRDGRPVLTGFVLSDEPIAEDRWFPVPEIPPGWKPNPKALWAADKENIRRPEPFPEAQPHAQWKRSKPSADERGAMLGETPLPSAPRSVFDYISQKDKERIQNIAAGLKTPSAVGGTDGISGPPSISITRIEPHIAQAALTGFQPFTSDPKKQARYIAYLRSQAVQDGSVPPLQQLPGQKAEDFNKEVGDYAKAASLFKPISGAMAGRFTSAAVVDFGPKIQEGLYTPTTEELAKKEEERKKEEEDKISPKAHAAKMGMYGPLTREKKLWQPARLLCKRFGVKEPNPEPEVPAGEAMAGSSSKPGPSFTQTEAEQQLLASSAKDASAQGQTSSGPRDLTNIGLGEDETQGRDTLTYERPSMDLFKAIFASDDEEEDENEDDEKAPDEDDGLSVVGSGIGNNVEEKKAFTSATKILDDTPVDINTFKPKFVPREGKAKKSKDEEKLKEKKEKKDKKKKEKKGVLVSFDLDEGGEGGALSKVKQPKDRPKKKRKEEHRRTEDGDEQVMFVAKGPSDGGVAPVPPALQEPISSGEAGFKGRKRAI